MNKKLTKKLKTLHLFFTTESNDSILECRICSTTAETIHITSTRRFRDNWYNCINLIVFFPLEYLHFLAAVFCLIKLIIIIIFSLKTIKTRSYIRIGRINYYLW